MNKVFLHGLETGWLVSFSKPLTWISKFLLCHLYWYIGPLMISQSLTPSSIHGKSHAISQGAVKSNKMNATMCWGPWSAVYLVSVSTERGKNPNFTMNYFPVLSIPTCLVSGGCAARVGEWRVRKTLGIYCGNTSSWEISRAFSAPAMSGTIEMLIYRREQTQLFQCFWAWHAGTISPFPLLALPTGCPGILSLATSAMNCFFLKWLKSFGLACH